MKVQVGVEGKRIVVVLQVAAGIRPGFRKKEKQEIFTGISKQMFPIKLNGVDCLIP